MKDRPKKVVAVAVMPVDYLLRNGTDVLERSSNHEAVIQKMPPSFSLTGMRLEDP
jgi:hypothetical protein